MGIATGAEAAEARRQLKLHRREEKLPRCACCGHPAVTEYILDLAPFGAAAVLCQVCVSRQLQENILEE